MTLGHRLRRLEDRADPPASMEFAMFDHVGRPLNTLARQLGQPRGPTFTITIDRANHDADEEAEQ